MPRTRTKASKKPAEKVERESDYWNVRYRRIGTQNKWNTGHLVGIDGLVVELSDRYSGNSRILDLSHWEVEYATQGPRRGTVWVDIILMKEEL